MTGLLCSPEEASCLIPNLIAELETPCPCEGLEGLVLCGLGYKGQRVTIRVRPGVLEVDGVPLMSWRPCVKGGVLFAEPAR